MFDTEDQRKSSLLMKYLLNFRDVDLRWLYKEHTDGKYSSFSIQSDYFAHNSTELQLYNNPNTTCGSVLWKTIYTPTLLFDFFTLLTEGLWSHGMVSGH